MSNPFLQQSQNPIADFDVTKLQAQYQDFLRSNPPSNPQQVLNNMVRSGQVSQGIVNKAIQIANMFPGFFR